MTDQEIRFSADESRHLLKSLRVQVGDEIFVTDGKGTLFHVRIGSFEKHVRGAILERKALEFDGCRLTLAVGLSRNDSMRWLVEKSTELGVQKILPVITARSRNVREESQRTALLERLRRVAVSALKQSKRVYLPVIDPPLELKPFLDVREDGSLRILLDETAEKPLLSDVISDPGERSCTIFVGPEGGLDEHERSRILDAGFFPSSLGRARLRVETAAIVAASALRLKSGSL